jgi:hypothetical protein
LDDANAAELLERLTRLDEQKDLAPLFALMRSAQGRVPQ